MQEIHIVTGGLTFARENGVNVFEGELTELQQITGVTVIFPAAANELRIDVDKEVAEAYNRKGFLGVFPFADFRNKFALLVTRGKEKEQARIDANKPPPPPPPPEPPTQETLDKIAATLRVKNADIGAVNSIAELKVIIGDLIKALL
jgi:hypothetical protein